MRNFKKRVRRKKSGGSEAFVEFLRGLEAKNRRFGPLRRPHPTARSVSFRLDRCYAFFPFSFVYLGKKFASANVSTILQYRLVIRIKFLEFIFIFFFFRSSRIVNIIYDSYAPIIIIMISMK